MTELYRHFDKAGRLLYVGISGSAYIRLTKGHKGRAAWFDEINNITIEKFATREEALQAERSAIRREKPLYNITHKDDGDQAEMFAAGDCGENLERIIVNRCNDGAAEPVAASFPKVGPAQWFLDLKKTARVVSVHGIDYDEFRGVDCYGQIASFYVRVGLTPAICSYEINRLAPPIFCTYRAA
jgi:excinuclease UvrABC nuclease subunit